MAQWSCPVDRGRWDHRPPDLHPGQRPVQPGLLPAAQDRPVLVRLRQGTDRLQRRAARGGSRRRRPPRRAALRVPPPNPTGRRPHAHQQGGQDLGTGGPLRPPGLQRDHHRVARRPGKPGGHGSGGRGADQRPGPAQLGGTMALSASALKVGDSRSEVVVTNLSRTQIVQYAGASGDYNPLHTDEVYTTQVAGFPSVFAHGMLTMGLTGRLLTDWAGDGRLLSYGARFEKQVWPGDTLTATATVEAIEDTDQGKVARFSVVTVNEAGDRVLSGTASARLDP